MTDDLRATVARAIDKAMPCLVPWPNGMKVVEECTDAAIAATLDWLAERAQEQGIEYVSSGYADSPEERMDFYDWLRAQMPEGGAK